MQLDKPLTTFELLQLLQSAINNARSLVHEQTRKSLINDRIRFDACLYRLTLISQIAATASPQQVSENPQLPWAYLTAFKQQIFPKPTLQADTVWDTFTFDFAAVDKLLTQAMLKDLGTSLLADVDS